MTDADLLRRAATRLRDPYRCNTDPDVDHALAEVFDRAADAIRELQFLANTHRLTEPGLAHLADLLAVRPVARAILREPASGGVVEPSPLTAEEAEAAHQSFTELPCDRDLGPHPRHTWSHRDEPCEGHVCPGERWLATGGVIKHTGPVLTAEEATPDGVVPANPNLEGDRHA